MTSRLRNVGCGVAVALTTLGLAGVACAQDKVIAKVNGKTISESDLRLADAEIGAELGQMPEPARRRILTEFLIENQLFADAAEGQKLASGATLDERVAYWRRRALRDLYFDAAVKGAVKDADAKAMYDKQVATLKPQEEVRARHILVALKDKDKARDIVEKIKHGTDFEALAKEHSIDPGSKDRGGDLGYFAQGQMVPQFETAAFALKKGEVSEPVESQFGWHIIKLEDRRPRPAPPFDALKERMVNQMILEKAQAAVTDLRGKAKIEFVDADIKKMVDDEANRASAAGAPPAPAKK